jgi:hypothetical protein
MPMKKKDRVFNILILIGRPAAGKSEIIAYLKNTSPENRMKDLKIGRFNEIDDFPMIWSWFEEDDILSRLGLERLHSTPEAYFKRNELWNVLIERLELEYWKQVKDGIAFGRSRTAIIEFARGSEHGGFASAFSHLSPKLLQRAAVLYIKVPFEESLRKNRLRKNPDKPHSILEHSLEDEKLRYLYGEVDWDEFSADDPDYLNIKGVRVPYRVFENGDDVTTGSGNNPQLGKRLYDCLSSLWSLCQN